MHECPKHPAAGLDEVEVLVLAGNRAIWRETNCAAVGSEHSITSDSILHAVPAGMIGVAACDDGFRRPSPFVQNTRGAGGLPLSSAIVTTPQVGSRAPSLTRTASNRR